MLNNLPTPTETLLLKAALLPGREALTAWQAWREAVPFADINYGAQRQLPLLFNNLKKLGVKDPILSRYEGVYKLYWSRNQILMHELTLILQALAEQQIPAMLIKGSAFNALGLVKPGLRPMVDLDIVVPTGRALEAVEIATRNGWSSQHPRDYRFSREDILFTQHGSFTKGQAVTLELHWESASQFRRGASSRIIWTHTIKQELNGVPFLTMNPADQLLQVCAHGGYWNPVAPIRWVSDALLIIAPDSIDWDYFQEQANRQRLTLVLRSMLRYLNTHFSAKIPESVMRHLEQSEVGILEKWEWSLLQSPPAHFGFFQMLGLHLCNLCRVTDGKPGLLLTSAYFKHYFRSKFAAQGAPGAIRAIIHRLGITLKRITKPHRPGQTLAIPPLAVHHIGPT